MELTRTNDLARGRRRIQGRWKLTSSDEVRYESENAGEEFSFTGVPVSAGPAELAVAATVRQENQKTVTRLFRLSGRWAADEKNRLVFEVERSSGKKKDALVFGGSWKSGDGEIVYSLRRGSQKLSLAGRWDITDEAGLVYLVGGDTAAGVRFRAAFQTRSVLAKKGEIRWQIGVEASGKRRFEAASVFGKWKVSRDLSLSFETGRGPRKRSVAFGGEYSLAGKGSVAVDLKSRRGEPLGIEVVFTRDLFGRDGGLFARLSRDLGETRVEAGIERRW